MASLTSANISFVLVIPGLYPSGIFLQGFDVDDGFTVDSVNAAQVQMGVDGRKSAGWLPRLFKQTISFMADSPSLPFLDALVDTQDAQQETIPLTAVITYPALSMIYNLNNGTLETFAPAADYGKILKSRKFVVTWEPPTRIPF